MFHGAGFRITLSLVLAVSLYQSLKADTTKFSAWAGPAWTDSTIPMQLSNGLLDPRQYRQVTSGDPNQQGILAFAAHSRGHLYIIGDEVDLHCVPYETYAQMFKDFVDVVRGVDPTARFAPSFGGLSPPTNCAGMFGKGYAEQFYNEYVTRFGSAPPVAEWRFNIFPSNLGAISAYKTDVSNFAAWSVAHGALMVPTFGFWEQAQATNVEPYMRDLMDFFNADWRIGAVVYWAFEGGQPHMLTSGTGDPRALTFDGMVYDDYTTNLVSPAQSGVSQLADFTGDGWADYADRAVATGDFYIHQNNQNGTFNTGNWGTGSNGAMAGWDVLVADFNGDSKADYADIHVASGQFWVHLNNGTGIGAPSFQSANWAYGIARAGADWETLVGDIDGDGFADIVEHNLRDGLLYWQRNLNNGSFAAANGGHSIGRTNVGPDWKTVIANFTGSSPDRRADFADLHVPSAQFWIHKNVTLTPNGGEPVFSAATWGYGAGTSGSGWQLLIGDFNGDGFADFADRWTATGAFWIHLSNGSGAFAAGTWGTGTTAAGSSWEVFGSR